MSEAPQSTLKPVDGVVVLNAGGVVIVPPAVFIVIITSEVEV